MTFRLRQQIFVRTCLCDDDNRKGCNEHGLIIMGFQNGAEKPLREDLINERNFDEFLEWSGNEFEKYRQLEND